MPSLCFSSSETDLDPVSQQGQSNTVKNTAKKSLMLVQNCALGGLRELAQDVGFFPPSFSLIVLKSNLQAIK